MVNYTGLIYKVAPILYELKNNRDILDLLNIVSLFVVVYVTAMQTKMEWQAVREM